MEIHAFDKIDERVDKLIEFKEKYGLGFDKRFFRENKTPRLFRENKDFSKEEIENITGESYENAIYYIALVDSVMDYETRSNGESGRKQELKEKMPLAIFCAEKIANQCAKNLQNNKASILNCEELSEKLLDDLVTLEAQGVRGLHVNFSMKKEMKNIMINPAFLIVLDKELKRKGVELNAVSYHDKDGHFTEKETKTHLLKLDVKEKIKQ